MEAKTQLADFFKVEASQQFRVLFRDGEIFVLRQVSTSLLNEQGILCGTIAEVIKRVKKHHFKAGDMMDFEFNDIAEVTNLENGQTIKLC